MIQMANALYWELARILSTTFGNGKFDEAGKSELIPFIQRYLISCKREVLQG